MGVTTSRAELQENKGTGCLRFGSGQSIGRRRVQEDTSWGFVGGTGLDPTKRTGNLRGFFIVCITLPVTFSHLIVQVCDGHGGVDAADFTSKNLMKYFLLDEKLENDCGQAMVHLLYSTVLGVRVFVVFEFFENRC